MGQPHQLGQDHAGLAVAQVVGLQAGQHQVGLLRRERSGQQAGGAQRIECAHLFLDVDGAIGAFGEGFANGLGGALGSGAQHHHLAPVFFFQLEAFFQGISIGLVDLVTEIGILNPGARWRDAQLRVAGRDLLDTNDDLHE